MIKQPLIAILLLVTSLLATKHEEKISAKHEEKLFKFEETSDLALPENAITALEFTPLEFETKQMLQIQTAMMN